MGAHRYSYPGVKQPSSWLQYQLAVITRSACLGLDLAQGKDLSDIPRMGASDRIARGTDGFDAENIQY